MNLRSARVVLRPRRAADILDLALPFCFQGWRLLLPLAAVVLLPCFVACLVARWFLGWSWPAVWLLAIGLGGLCHAPFTAACAELLFHDAKNARLGPVMAVPLRRMPAFVGAQVASRVLLLVTLVFFVAWPFTVVATFCVHEAVLLEGAGPFAALRRSARAARGQGGATFGVACAVWFAPLFGVFAAEVTGQALVTTVLQWGEPFGDLWSRGGTPYALAGFFLTIPLAVAARFLKYIDLRTRKEGWDIQLRFAEIAAGSAGMPMRGDPPAAGTTGPRPKAA